jgi:tetratricopeptide (TPR) repeat protein
MARDRASLVIVANQELAYLYNHEAIGKAAEALAFLEKVAKDIPSDDDRMARIHLLQIQSQLVLQKNDEAVKTLELMYDRFEHTRETAQACKSVAIRLDEITSAELKKLAPGAPLPDAAKENLKKISRYYGKWLQGAMAYTMNVTVSDVMSVAETLYLTARRLNGLPDAAFSFMDLKKGMIVGWKNYFEDAEFVHGLLIDKFRTKLVEKDRLTFMMRRARCLSFIADNADGWMRAKQAYEDISKEFKVVNEKGVFNSGALIAQPLLVGTYLEQGAVYYELGRWNKIHFDNAIKVFSDITSVANPGGEPWWISRYMTLLAHFKRGKDKDIMTAQIGIKMLQDNYPDFDGGKYGLKEKFLELKREIDGR